MNVPNPGRAFRAAARDPAHAARALFPAGESSRRWASARASSRRSPRAASSGCRRPKATSSSSTSARPSATTRRRRCIATTRSTASSSTGSRSRGRRRSSRPCSATSITRPRNARPALRSRAQDLRAGNAALHVPRPATYVEHRGERPVAFTWRLPAPMPEELFEVARSVAAA